MNRGGRSVSSRRTQGKRIPLRWLALWILVVLVCLCANFRVLHNYELSVYDAFFKLRSPREISPDIVIIEISDDTLRNLGEWPLPRDFQASLVDVLKESGVRLIVFDILFSEPTLYDEVLAAAFEKAGNVYLPVAFQIPESPSRKNILFESNELVAGVAGSLSQKARGIGHINVYVDDDGKIRRVPLYISSSGRLVPNLGFSVACDWLGLDSARAVFEKDRVNIDNKFSLPLGSDGTLAVNYPDKWRSSFIHLSYFDILKAYSEANRGILPELDLAKLKGKICFIGLTAAGTSDLKASPLEKTYPMLGLQASVFNSIVTGSFIKEARRWQNIFVALILFILSFIIAARCLPLKAFAISLILTTGYFAFSALLFILYGVWIDVFFPLALVGITYAGLILGRLIIEIHNRQLLENELAIAREIQKSSLPAEVAESGRFSLAAFIQPARFVGGDLYDIIKLDENRLGILIGDVSGKGISAALLMAQTISLFRVFARQFTSPKETISRLNQELCGRFAERFVTCLYLVVDAQSSQATACLAGHPPLLHYHKDKGEVLEQALAPGVPLGIIDGAQYSDTVFKVQEGDKLILFSDGLNEARNPQREEFGVENVKRVIEKNAGFSSGPLLEALKQGVFEFARGASQHDDITLVILGDKEG